MAEAKRKGKVEITWYGHSAFTIRTPGGRVLLTDPWLSNPRSPDPRGERLGKVDDILLSHGHNDHVGEAVQIGRRTGARLITNVELGGVLASVGYPAAQAAPTTVGNMGGTVQAGDAAVTMVPALHSSGLGEPGNPGDGGNPMGFVVRVARGPTLYFTGDTDVTMDMRLIPERFGPVDVMLACIGGHFTMDPDGAALAARMVRPRTVIPMHYGTFPLLAGTPDALRAALRRRRVTARVRALEPGVPAEF